MEYCRALRPAIVRTSHGVVLGAFTVGEARAKILIADDHVAYRRALMRFIDSHDDMKVIGAVPDGRSVAALAWAEQPDVVVVDLFMPGVDGFEATRQVKALDNAPAVIAVTAQRMQGLDERCQVAGVDAFLHKSWVEFDLHGVIRRLVSERARVEPIFHDDLDVPNSALVWSADAGMPDRRARVRVSVS